MENSSDYLRNAEDSSLERSTNSSLRGGISDAREAEDSFVSSVGGASPSRLSFNKKANVKFKLKKAAPLIVVAGVVVAIATVLFLSQLSMPFAIVNRLIEEYNTAGVSSVLRADNLLDIQLSMTGTNFGENEIGLTDQQKASFKENGIIPVDTGSGSTALVYKKNNNKYSIVVTTALVDSCRLNDVATEALPEDTQPIFTSPACISVADAFEDPDFKTPYRTASKTWRGGSAGWYDPIEQLAEAAHGYTRARWVNYAAKGTEAAMTQFNKIAVSAIKKAGEASSAVAQEAEVKIDESSKQITSVEVKEPTKAETIANALGIATRFLSAAKLGKKAICGVVQGLMSVQTLTSTYQKLQKMNVSSGYLEAVQRVQSGMDSTPMQIYNEKLLEKNSETGKSAMNSAGMGALMTGSAIDTNNDENVQMVNAENLVFGKNNQETLGLMDDVIKEAVKDATGLVEALKICTYADTAISFASATLTATSLALIIANPVTGGFALGAVGVVAVVKTVALLFAPGIIEDAATRIGNYVFDKIGDVLVKDIATEWVGEALGNALVAGGNNVIGANSQTGGQGPADATYVGYFKRAQEKVIAEEAEYQRRTHSPFDINSQYTFLGSIVYNLIPLATSTNVGSILTSVGTLLNSSVTKMLPTASAVAETKMVGFAEVGDCPMLESIGIQGDPFCNPLIVSDRSTSSVGGMDFYSDAQFAALNVYSSGPDYSPEEIIRMELDWNQIEKSGNNYKIKPGTDLAHYVLYCGQRASSWGIADANIAESLNGEKSRASNLLSMIPIVGDLLDVIHTATETENLKWTTGSACVASDSNPDWPVYKIHQRFLEDQRFFYNIGAFSKDAITSFMGDYYKENPLDNSFEGILARYSGMTKTDVIATLELMEGLQYLADYNPSTRYAFYQEKDEATIFYEDTTELALLENQITTEPKYIIYNELRNRVVMI